VGSNGVVRTESGIDEKDPPVGHAFWLKAYDYWVDSVTFFRRLT